MSEECDIVIKSSGGRSAPATSQAAWMTATWTATRAPWLLILLHKRSGKNRVPVEMLESATIFQNRKWEKGAQYGVILYEVKTTPRHFFWRIFQKIGKGAQKDLTLPKRICEGFRRVVVETV